MEGYVVKMDFFIVPEDFRARNLDLAVICNTSTSSRIGKFVKSSLMTEVTNFWYPAGSRFWKALS